MVKLIVSDLDGTLLPMHGEGLTLKTKDLIQKLLDKGIHFCAASGRQLYSEYKLFSYIDDYKTRLSYISDNGSICIHDGKVLFENYFDPEMAKEIIRKVKEYPYLELAVSGTKGCYIESKNKEYVKRLTADSLTNAIVVDDCSQIEDSIIKIAFLYRKKDGLSVEAFMEYFREYFYELLDGEIRIITSGFRWIDFIPTHINKGTTLSLLLKRLDIKPEECIAFGDQQNDIEMLELVGTSYAMSHGSDLVKEAATHVVDSVDEVLEALLT